MKHMSKGFTLVELLVATSVVVLLTGVLLPVCGKARRQARALRGMSQQRAVVSGVTMYALDRNDRYPESVATLGVKSQHWNWQEPMMLTGYRARSPRLHRSMSAYMKGYVKDAGLLSCPSAPSEYQFMQQSWDAGDAWDNPNTDPLLDPVIGTYCFYWNYIGYLPHRGEPFRGPGRMTRLRKQSTLLMSDYFGFDHWRSPQSYHSCERLGGAVVTPETWISSSYWSLPVLPGLDYSDQLSVILHAGYTDGHFEAYSITDLVPMLVSITDDGSEPYPAGVGPGIIYLPRDSIR